MFAAINASAAWAGAIGLVTGDIDFGDTLDDRLPFDSLLLAGFALAAIVAIPLTVLAWCAWTGHRRTDELSLVVGVALIGWIIVQLIFLQAFSLFQAAYLAVGAGFVAASHRVRLRADDTRCPDGVRRHAAPRGRNRTHPSVLGEPPVDGGAAIGLRRCSAEARS